MDDAQFEEMIARANITDAQRAELREVRKIHKAEVEAKEAELAQAMKALKDVKVDIFDHAARGITSKRAIEMALKGEK